MCRYIKDFLAEDCTVNKLVLVGAPLNPVFPGPTQLSCLARFQSVRESVQVLPSAFAFNGPTTSDKATTDPCLFGTIGSNAALPKNFTIVFWTGGAAVWTPSCPEASFLDPDDRVLAQLCPHVDSMWNELAKSLVASGVSRLTVVNAASIPPRFTTVKQHLAKVRAGTADHNSTREHFYTMYRKHCRNAAVYKGLDVGDMPFLSLEEWLETADWQDVFSPAEISDHFIDLAADRPMPERWARYVRFAQGLGLRTSTEDSASAA